mgnify:CR=1 FL=1
MQTFNNRAELFRHMPRGIVAEIGVHHGDNAQTILDSASADTLILIDCWEQQSGPYARDPSNTQLKGVYEQVVKRFAANSSVSVLKMYSSVAAMLFTNEAFDWVYIDADHTLQAVRADLAMWWPKVKVRGFLCGHDYIVDKYNKSYSYIQVKQAVNEFCQERVLELYALTDEKYGSWAIRRDK